MTQRLGVAIVGGGSTAEVHARSARVAEATIVGVVSSTPERGAAAATRMGVRRAYGDLGALLADDRVDVVHVCTPNVTHREIAEAVVAAGKHVVCEKPLATDPRAARGLRAAAERAGVVATVPFVYRFHPLVREARARVVAGTVGRVTTVLGTYLQDWLGDPADDDWRVGVEGGPSRAFADIGSHLVDAVEFVTTEPIVRLLARTRTVFPHRGRRVEVVRTEDLAAVLVELAGGAVGTLLVSQVAPGRKNGLTLEVAGSAESLRFEQESPEYLWIGRRRGSELLVRDAAQLSPAAARLCAVPAGHPQGYADAFAAFVADTYAAVGGAAPEGLPRFDDGGRAAELTNAVLRSAATDRWVDVPAEHRSTEE